ncbi:hypothetical protein SO802_023062 [Lithocarpus litseifolius]|uniref:Eukaryotic translation initiation factor isoform 4E n=1 Tax=Lithocarpus litseifolius TaxID=425828 RepID=A0AAW2C8C3_9ROSI
MADKGSLIDDFSYLAPHRLIALRLDFGRQWYYRGADRDEGNDKRTAKVGEQVDVLVRQPVETLQDFKPSKLLPNANFHLFRAGIEPKWDDPECAARGKWSITSSKKANLDTMWLETAKISLEQNLLINSE